MSLYDAIFSILKTDSAIFTITSNRIYTDEQIEDFKKTFIRYFRVSEFEIETLTNQTKMLISANIQIDCFSNTRHDADALAILVRKRLKDLSGTFQGVEIQTVIKQNRYSGLEKDGDELYYIESLEFQFWYYE